MNILGVYLRLNNSIRGFIVRPISSRKVNALKDLLMTMPKDNKVTVELQKQRQKLKEKNNKYTPGSVTLQVLGSGAKGAPRSLYVFTDQSRYLFNCGEGTQRLAHEHKMKLAKLEHIFITHPCWENIGGLPGVALTIQDVGVPEITIHGPQGMSDIFMATRRFVVLKDLNVKFCTPAVGPFEDSVMKVQYVPIAPLKMNSLLQKEIEELDNQFNVENDEDEEDYYAYEKVGAAPSKLQTKRQKVSGINGRKRIRRDNNVPRLGQTQATSICYICRLHPKPGTLLLGKCVELGVPPGPLLGKLKAGQDVTLSNGIVVKASDVCSLPDPGPTFLVIDCPSIDYIDALLTNEELIKYSQTRESENMEAAVAVVHFCPPEVLSEPRYANWVSTFPTSTTHLSFGEGNNCTGSVAVHRLQYKLNLLHPKLFPILADCGIPEVRGNVNHEIDEYVKKTFSESFRNDESQLNETSINVASKECECSQSKIIKACTFYNVHLRPRKGFDSSAALKMDWQEFIDETLAVDGFKELLQQLKKKLECVSPIRDSFPKVLFLGTGSCIPNKTRNTSGIFIEISEKSCMLLDCGEGTYGQLVRFFGKKESDKLLHHLHCIFVSHLHADHHIGLISLLKQRQLAFQNSQSMLSTLYLLAPCQIMFWLSFYHNHFESILNGVKLVPCSEVIDKSIDSTSEHPLAAKDMTNILDLKEMVTAAVCHCPNAFGIAISHKEGWKITYSGDTMPCADLIKIGKGSDLLIHEATMEDELVEEAKSKRHSTTSEAITVGHEMNARFTILTHFSQRYAKLPRIKGSMKENVGIAFDNMQVTLDDLKILPLLYPALKLMFSEHCEEMDQKANRRKLKLEREKSNVL